VETEAQLKLYEAGRPYHESFQSTPAVTQSH
jgi:hypothetical protein